MALQIGGLFGLVGFRVWGVQLLDSRVLMAVPMKFGFSAHEKKNNVLN